MRDVSAPVRFTRKSDEPSVVQTVCRSPTGQIADLTVRRSDKLSVGQTVSFCFIPVDRYGLRALCKARTECYVSALRHAVERYRYDRTVMMIVGADRVNGSRIGRTEVRLSGIVFLIEAYVFQDVALVSQKAVIASAHAPQLRLKTCFGTRSARCPRRLGSSRTAPPSRGNSRPCVWSVGVF